MSTVRKQLPVNDVGIGIAQKLSFVSLSHSYWDLRKLAMACAFVCVVFCLGVAFGSLWFSGDAVVSGVSATNKARADKKEAVTPYDIVIDASKEAEGANTEEGAFVEDNGEQKADAGNRNLDVRVEDSDAVNEANKAHKYLSLAIAYDKAGEGERAASFYKKTLDACAEDVACKKIDIASVNTRMSYLTRDQ